MLRKNLSTEDTEGTDHRNLDGCRRMFFGCASARNLGGNLFKEWPWARNYYGSTEHTEGTDHRNLYGI